MYLSRRCCPKVTGGYLAASSSLQQFGRHSTCGKAKALVHRHWCTDLCSACAQHVLSRYCDVLESPFCVLPGRCNRDALHYSYRGEEEAAHQSVEIGFKEEGDGVALLPLGVGDAVKGRLVPPVGPPEDTGRKGGGGCVRRGPNPREVSLAELLCCGCMLSISRESRWRTARGEEGAGGAPATHLLAS